VQGITIMESGGGTEIRKIIKQLIYVTWDLVDNNNTALLIVWSALQGKSDQREDGS